MICRGTARFPFAIQPPRDETITGFMVKSPAVSIIAIAVDYRDFKSSPLRVKYSPGTTKVSNGLPDTRTTDLLTLLT